MFVNHTNMEAFEIFEQKFEDCLYERYTHLKNYAIQCYTIEQYQYLKNRPEFECFQYDSFGFAADDSIKDQNGNIFIAIVVSPEICKSFNLNEDELLAGIGHEIGHIVHYSNTSLKDAHQSYKEIKADEIACALGLTLPLISLLKKLKDSKLYSDDLLNLRIKILNIEA